MRMKIAFILFAFTLVSFVGLTQETAPEDTFYVTKTVIVDGDTIPNVSIEEVVVFPKLVFKNERQSRRYRKLIRDVRKAYPYAQYAKMKLDEMESEFNKLTTEKERKKYVKTIEKELMGEFGSELKKLTITQGRILLKLIDRETGDTSYELLKELRGGVSAVFWQAIARLFGSDLKSRYDPKGNDYLIERVVRLIETNQIQLDKKILERLKVPF
ncbi:MAG: DUF4294 domain-containing protein [Bacteroidales bacterium]|nr:DUF4294 domain-containing protein [Bacteroidales bacterium]